MTWIRRRILLVPLLALFVLALSPYAFAASTEPSHPAERSTAPAFVWHGFEATLLDAINARRAAAGLGPVILDVPMTQIARARSADMATQGYFAHRAPDGTTAFSLLNDYGIWYWRAGEIIARNNVGGIDSVGTAFNGFINSPSHRAAILNPAYNWAGVGFATAGSMKYFTVVFIAD